MRIFKKNLWSLMICGIFVTLSTLFFTGYETKKYESNHYTILTVEKQKYRYKIEHYKIKQTNKTVFNYTLKQNLEIKKADADTYYQLLEVAQIALELRLENELNKNILESKGKEYEKTIV